MAIWHFERVLSQLLNHNYLKRVGWLLGGTCLCLHKAFVTLGMLLTSFGYFLFRDYFQNLILSSIFQGPYFCTIATMLVLWPLKRTVLQKRRSTTKSRVWFTERMRLIFILCVTFYHKSWFLDFTFILWLNQRNARTDFRTEIHKIRCLVIQPFFTLQPKKCKCQ